MPALFTQPQFVALSATNQLLPGAKLYFRISGTSTPQPTYQDIALTVAHANPVVADGAGVFAPIYLDPSLPSYRVILADSADVTQPDYPIDNYPSNQNAGQTYRLKSVAPELIFEETDAAAGNQKWRLRVNAQQFTIDLLNDAESVATAIATFTRSGISSPSVDFGSAAVNFAAGFLTVANLPAVTIDVDSFTATFTGMTAATTGSVAARRYGGGLCVLYAAAAITGTSNTTAMTFSGIPAAFRPAGNTTAFALMTDNGAVRGGLATVDSAGVVTFGIGVDGTTAFTNSGTKGIPARWALVYVNN